MRWKKTTQSLAQKRGSTRFTTNPDKNPNYNTFPTIPDSTRNSHKLPSDTSQSAEQLQTKQIQTEQVHMEQFQTKQAHKEQFQTKQVQTKQVQTEQVQTEQVQTEQVYTKQFQTEKANSEQVNGHTRNQRAKSLSTPEGFAGNFPIFTPVSSIPSPTVFQECIEGIAKANEGVVASLARQNLLKYLQLWKKVFEAMIHDANLNANQQMAYLRNYTKGKVRELVDNYRKMQNGGPTITLRELWAEMEKRFGNTAITTNSLLERLQ